jgi:hypothetical protein
MKRFICTDCKSYSYSSASLDMQLSPGCIYCGSSNVVEEGTAPNNSTVDCNHLEYLLCDLCPEVDTCKSTVRVVSKNYVRKDDTHE